MHSFIVASALCTVSPHTETHHCRPSLYNSFIWRYTFAACLACSGKSTISHHAWLHLIPLFIAEGPQCKSTFRAPFARSESTLSWPWPRMPNCFLLGHGRCVLIQIFEKQGQGTGRGPGDCTVFSDFNRQLKIVFVDFDLRTPIVCKKRQRMGRGPGQFSVFQIAGGVRFLRSIAYSAESLHGI